MTACLRTTIVNRSGGRKFFPFIPPYGAELNDDEEFTADGDIFDWMPRRAKLTTALEYCVDNGLIEIKQTPTPLMYDATLDQTRSLKTDNNQLSLVDPCYAGGGNGVVIGP